VFLCVDRSLIGDGTIIARRSIRKWELNTGKEQGLGKMRKLTETGKTRQVCYKYSMFYIKPLCQKKKRNRLLPQNLALLYHKSSTFAIGGKSPSESTLFFPQSIGFRCQ
jgi:hypothetical protein